MPKSIGWRTDIPRAERAGSANDATAHVGRCRLCTTNDRDALIDHVAAEMWESRRHDTQDDLPWRVAGGYWRPIDLELATTTVEAMSR